MPLAPDMLDRARRVNLLGYLKQLGHRPVAERPSYALFHSPLREDRHPSFSVTLFKGRWYWKDFATQEHGDTLAFAQRYHHCTFEEAASRLLAEPPPTASIPSGSRTRRSNATLSPERIRMWYARLHAQQSQADRARIRQAFSRLYVPFDPRFGTVLLRLHTDPAHPNRRITYLGFPVPTPDPDRLVGLECRAIDPVPNALRKRAFGRKTFWHAQRPGLPTLITESILDCLAADRLFGPRYDLLALNTIHNVPLIETFLAHWSPPALILAFDNDHPDRGPKAELHAIDLLRAYPIPLFRLTIHHAADVKDLHALVRQTPNRREDPQSWIQELR